MVWSETIPEPQETNKQDDVSCIADSFRISR